MSANPKVVAFEAELAKAEEIAAKRRAVPELTAEEILEGFKAERGLRHADIAGFGRIHYRHPMTVTERYELDDQLRKNGGESVLARDLVDIVIARALNADGSHKFRPEHAVALLQAPFDSLAELAKLLFQNRVSFESAEKK